MKLGEQGHGSELLFQLRKSAHVGQKGFLDLAQIPSFWLAEEACGPTGDCIAKPRWIA